MNLDEYNNTLNTWVQSEKFAGLTDEEQQTSLKQLRQQYIDQNPNEDVDAVNNITESNNKFYLRATGKGRVIPTLDNETLGLQEYDELKKEDRSKAIEDFRSRIPEIAKNNPTQKEDTEYYLGQVADEMERRNNGENRSWVGDKFARAGEGLVAGLLNYVGADDMAEASRKYFFENPDMDEDYSSMLASGLGDMGASMTIFLGTALTTKGLGGTATTATRAATATSLASNGIMRYNEAYRNAVEKGLDDATASDAGVAALPAAIVDVLGDRIIGSNFFPDNVSKVFKTGTLLDKQKALGQLIKDTGSKAKLFEIGRSALGEGMTEVAGDYIAAYGPYLTTGVDDFLPTDEQMRDSFLIGAVLGGGISAAAQAPQFIGNKQAAPPAEGEQSTRYSTVDQMRLGETQRNLGKIDTDASQQVYDLLYQGQYKGALDLSNQLMREKELELEQNKAALDQQQSTVQPTTNEQGQLLLEDNPDVQTIDQRKAEFFGSLPNPNNTVYQKLTDTIFESSSLLNGVDADPLKLEQSNTIINAAAPNRSLIHQQIDAVENVTPEQAIGTKVLIDTVASKWLATNPDRDISEFYKRVNFESNPQGFLNLSGTLLTSPAKGPQGVEEQVRGSVENNTVELGPQATIDNMLSGMVTVMRSSGIMEESLTPQEFQTVKDSLGIDQDFTEENDQELANRFRQWLGNQQGDLSPVFGKIKQWMQDIYKSFRSLISPKNRNQDLDKVFESLFQVTLTPREFKTKTDKKQQTVGDSQTIQQQDSTTLTEAQRRFEDAKNEVRKVVATTPPTQAPLDIPVESTKASDVLTGLIESNPEWTVPLNAMIRDIQTKNPTLTIQLDESLAANGMYNPSTNHITIGTNNLEFISHEVAHALTNSDVERYIDSRDGVDYRDKLNKALKDKDVPDYFKNLINTYLYTAKTLGYNPVGNMDLNYLESNNVSLDEYQFSNLDEFIAAAFSSQSFQERLANIPYNGRTVWEHIVEAITQSLQWMRSIANPELLLRSNGENALVSTLASVNQIINSDKKNILFSPNENTRTLEDGSNTIIGPAVLYLPAYHGTPHKVDRFSLDRINTGEGSQAYGWGLYFAENQSVAAYYQETLGKRLFQKMDDILFLDTYFTPEERWDAIQESKGFTEDQMKGMRLLHEEDWLGYDYPPQAMQMLLINPDGVRDNYDISSELYEWAKNYKDNPGSLYKVELNINEGELLDWDSKEKPDLIKSKLSKVLDYVRSRNPSLYTKSLNFLDGSMNGSEIYSSLTSSGLSPQEASEYLNSIGIKGIKYLDGYSRQQGSGNYNFVVFDESLIQIVEENGNPVSFESISEEPKKNILYSPEQTRNQKLANHFKRLQSIKKGNLNDKFDSQTKELTGLLSTIKGSDVYMLGQIDSEMQDHFFRIVDNIYESRKNAVSNPQNRVPTDALLIQVQKAKDLMDSMAIAEMIGQYDELIDWNNINLEDRAEVEQAINNYLKQDSILDESRKADRSAKRKEMLNRKYAKYRQKYNDLRQQSITRFADPDNYIKELGAIWGSSLDSNEILRDFMKLHFDYLTKLDVDSMEGIDLYKHFYALNNLFDGNGGYFELTVAKIAQDRNAAANVSSLQGSFRDPVWDNNKFIYALDKINQKGELAQSQLQRFSAFEKTRNFIQDDLLGELFYQVITVAENRATQLKTQASEAIKQFESNTGRAFGMEDRVIVSIASRLMQYTLGENPDVALKRNIKKERQSIENQIRRGTRENRTLFQTKIIPIFNQMVDGLESMDRDAMTRFHETLDARMRGSYDLKTSKERQAILSMYQELFSGFDLESRLISEGFHKTPFKQMAYYVQNNVSTLNSSPSEVKAGLTDPMDSWEDLEFKSGLKSKDSHFHERQESLRKDQFYSYNIESMIDRNITRIVVDNTTITERFVLAKRLAKGSQLNQIISGDTEQNDNRIEGIKDLAKGVLNNAISRGEPGNLVSDVMRTAVNGYARVALSGLHHIISQPLTAVTDYSIRTGNLTGWFDALRFYTQNVDKVDEWFNTNQVWTGKRGALEVASLDTRSVREDSKIKSSKQFKTLEKLYEGAGNLMTIAIRNGDRYSAKATVLAEYVRLLKDKGYKFRSIEDIWDNPVEGRLLTQAVLNSERNINTSGKTLRGELFSDRRANMTIIRNLLFAFSSHSANLTTQASMAVRDLIDLRAMNASREEMMPKIKTLAAISAQTLAFTSASWMFGSMMSRAMISIIQSMFDDEEGKLAELEERLAIAQEKGDPVKIAEARQELAMAKSVRTVVEKMKYNSQSTSSFFKRAIRDQAGSTMLIFSNSDVLRINPVFWLGDKWMEHIHNESNQEIVKDYELQIREAKEDGDIREAARLSEELVTFRAQEYIPLVYKDYGTMETGGIYGAALGFYDKSMTNLLKGVTGAQEFDLNDVIISASTIGLGQSDLTKLLNGIDKIENEQFEKLNTYNESALPKALIEKEEQQDRKNRALINSLIR